MATPTQLHISETKSAVVCEQIQVLSNNQLVSLPINSVLSLTIASILWTEINNALLLSWVAAVSLVNAVRLVMAIRQHRASLGATAGARVLRLQCLLTFLAGLIWSFVPASMISLTDSRAPLIIFIICGITAGAAIQSSCSVMLAAAFVLPVMPTLAVKMLVMGGYGSMPVAGSSILFVILILQASRRGEASFVNTVRLRLQATMLAASLNREHMAAKASAERLYRLANHDSLTGLANRSAFSAQLETCLIEARASSTSFALFLLDLDHFKSVNDTLGHSAGDVVLKTAASRLLSELGADHPLARLGGDEFALLYRHRGERGPDLAEDAERVAVRILATLSDVFVVGEHAVNLGLSIGLAMFPEDGSTAEELLAHADLALYGAKDGGRHRWRRFDAALLAQATVARDIEHDLPAALAEGALQVVYQPQIALSDHRLTGLEALLRWRHPVHGWISPPTVVAAARRIRQSESLTSYVLDDACRQIHRMRALGFPKSLVAVNVSPSELDQYDLPALVRRAIARHGVDPDQLELEITEETFAASERALATLTDLSAMGVRLAIDDFGTGCSALAYLRSMSVDRIKIDRSFVTGLADRAGDRILVQAILGIGRSFGIEVLAEGVETIEEAKMLEGYGCNTVQGYYFGRPLDQTELVSWLAAHAHRPSGIDLVTSIATSRRASECAAA